MKKNKIIIIVAFSLGCILCFEAHEVFQLSSVVSSALIGLLGSFVTSSKRPIINSCPAAIYSGSFAGMCSVEIIQSFDQLLGVSLLGGFIYLSLESHFKGIGGKLGTVAFTSVALVYLINKGFF